MRRRPAAALVTGIVFASVVAAAPPVLRPEVAAPAASDAAARAAVRALPAATTVNDLDGDRVFDDLAATAATSVQPLPIIVTFRHDVDRDAAIAAAESAAPSLRIERRFSIVPAASGTVLAADLPALGGARGVRQVEQDDVAELELDTATNVMGADAAVDRLGVSGDADGDVGTATSDDVVIAVLDTGIDTGHQDLEGKVIDWVDLADGTSSPNDSNGHGTHVASIAAGWGVHRAHRGVAPGAALVGIAIGSESDAIAGYEYVVNRRDELNIRVATMSFGFGTATDGTTALALAVDAAWDAGIVTFKSTGNSGPANGTMTVPAAARGILAIGSLLDPYGGSGEFGFALSEFSSRGPTTDGRVKPDLAAPGDTISAANRGTRSGYTVKSGTSMAAPFAAGATALVLAANPDLTPDEVRDLLFATAEDRGAEGADNDFGHGRIQVFDAVREALRLAEVETTGDGAPRTPAQATLTGPAEMGEFEATFEVTSLMWPVGATVLTDGVILRAEILGPDGSPAMPGRLAPVNLGDRHHNYWFRPSATGVYTVRVLATPNASVVVDLSFGTVAPPPAVAPAPAGS